MLKQLFGGAKPDHPLADPKEARRLLDELPGNDPLAALDELTHWHESLRTTEGFRVDDLIELHFLLDDSAQPRLRKIARDYLASARPSRFQENRMWTHVYDYWRQCGLGYASAVQAAGAAAGRAADAARPLAAPLAVRGLRALGQQLKWLYFRYGPVDRALWQALAAVYAFAEARQVTDTRTPVYTGATAESSPRQEFLRALMLNAASPDSLLPPEVETAERLVAELAPSFELKPRSGDGLSHWIDLGQPLPPQRVGKASHAAPGVRYFGAGNALGALESDLRKIEGTGKLPPGIAATGLADAEAAADLLRHLVLYWSAQPPERKHPRHRVKSRLSIVHGFDGVVAALDTAASLDFEQQPENWIVENVSAGGFGAAVPQAKGDWLKIGTLLAMQPDGGNNWVVGMIRRVSKAAGQEARVGIQTLSRAPELVSFGLNGAQESGVLLPAALPGGGETSIVLRSGVFAAGQNLESERGGKSYVYMPQRVAERGEDYDIVRFREMIREA